MIESVKRPICAWLGCVFALALLALAAYEVDPFERLDAHLLSVFGSHKASSPGTIALAVAHLGDPLPTVAMLVGICALGLYLGRQRQAIAAAILVGGANLTTQLLKGALAHPRYQPILGYHHLWSTAFPSGHVTAVASLSLALLLVVPRSWRRPAALAGVILVAAVSVSVLILYRHYPSDVLGGILVAGGWWFATIAALRVAGRMRPARAAQLASPAAISVK